MAGTHTRTDGNKRMHDASTGTQPAPGAADSTERVTGGILRCVVVGGRGGKAVAEVERSEGEATGLEGERSAAGGAAGCGGRGTPPRVDGCRHLEAGRGTVVDGYRYACFCACSSKTVFRVGLCRLHGDWWRLGVPRRSPGLGSGLRLQRERGLILCKVSGLGPATVLGGRRVFPSRR